MPVSHPPTELSAPFEFYQFDELTEERQLIEQELQEEQCRADQLAASTSSAGGRLGRRRWELVLLVIFAMGVLSSLALAARQMQRLRSETHRPPVGEQAELAVPNRVTLPAPVERPILLLAPEGDAFEDEGEAGESEADDGEESGVEPAPTAVRSSTSEVSESQLQRWCAAGSYGSCITLGRRAADGGRPTEAIAYYATGCQAGAATACYLLGRAQARGLASGVPDYESAVAAYSQACPSRPNARSHSLSCYRLGVLTRDGRGRPPDAEEARRLFRRSCGSENAYACAALGLLELAVAENADALGHFRQACDAGLGYACGSAGFLLANGRGVPQDEVEAVSLYQRGCERGAGESCTSLSYMHRHGRGGLQQNRGRARELAGRACALGDSSSCESDAVP